MLNLSFFLSLCFYNRGNHGEKKMFLITATEPLSVTP